MSKVWVAGVLLALGVVNAQARGKPPAEPARQSREDYVRAAKSRPADPGFNPGSLWVEGGTEGRAFSDFKARQVDDVVIIQITENTNALSSGDTSTSKKGTVKSGLPKFFGLERRVGELPSLLSGESENTFRGNGTAKRSQSLSTTVAARVTDVLPNGNLVVQAVREIRVDNENQTLIIQGVVRPRDVSPQNVVSSRAVSDMQIRLNGKGLITEQLKPGFLHRLLMKVLPF